MKKTSNLKVFISSRDSTGDECGDYLGRKAWIILVENKGALCLACADLDHLLFLPSSLGKSEGQDSLQEPGSEQEKI